MFFLLSICVAVLLGFLAGAVESELRRYNTGRYKYEVILDDDYPAAKLYDEYDVVEQRGKIWVIEDKED